MTEISNLYRDFPETRSRCWHTESIYWHPDYMGLLEPFRAISAKKPDLSNFLVKSPKKYVYYPQVLRTWSLSILKIKQWQNFLYEQYLRYVFWSLEKRSCFSAANQNSKSTCWGHLKRFHLKYTIFTFFKLNLIKKI